MFIFGLQHQPMKSLPEILKQKENYKKIKFKVTKTNHLLIKATINGITGNFILDTGASNSCVDFENVGHFKLNAVRSKTTAAGAGAIDMITKTARKNQLKIGRWKYDDFNLVIFDLSHVNIALQQHKAKPVQGIIGADVLKEGKAVIDYYNHNLYLR
jgi:predicted aspartyl protease